MALDPNDGSVLAMASYPTYQPSVYVGRPDEAKLAPLLDSKAAAKANYPGLNRAIDASYPPGSTFKPVTALAAMQEHLMTPYEIIPCTPTFTDHKELFHNWTPLINQGMDLTTALAESCDTYFYELGKRFYTLGPNRGHPLQGWANRFGLGEPTGIDIKPETSGLIPTPEWLKENYTAARGYGVIDRIWKPGYSIQMAIGQGQILVTPLQMTRLYAMIANGGKLVTPHLAEDVEQSAGTGQTARVLRRFGGQQPEPTGVDPTALQFVREGLLEATQSKVGTSFGVFGNFPISISGKTGTAEKPTNVPGYPRPAQPEPVLVVRLRPDRQPVDRRLRRHRERRPRRHLGGAGGSEGVRAVLRQAVDNHGAHVGLRAARWRSRQSTHAPAGFARAVRR